MEPPSPERFQGNLAAARSEVDSLVASGQVAPQVAAAAAGSVLELHRHGMSSQDLMMADYLLRSDPAQALDRWYRWMDDARGNGTEQLTVRLSVTTASVGALLATGLTGTTHLLPGQVAAAAIPIAGTVAAVIFGAGSLLTFLQRRENAQLRYRRQLGSEYIQELLRPRP